MTRRAQQLPLPEVEEVYLTPAQRTLYFGKYFNQMMKEARRGRPVSVLRRCR